MNAWGLVNNRHFNYQKFWHCLVFLTVAVLTANNECLAVDVGDSTEKELPPLHHVVAITPSDKVTVPAHFPLGDNGVLVCKTCHADENIDTQPIESINKNTAEFFRDGPYQPLTDFCYRCHDKESAQRNNIHKQLLPSGELDKQQCEYCHAQVPDPKAIGKETALHLRLPAEKICLGCHLKTPHLNSFNHLEKPSNAVRKQMIQAEKQLNISLPLDSQGKVMCATCHSPHEPGVISIDHPAGKQVADATVEEGVQYRRHEWNSVYQADKKTRLKHYSKITGKLVGLEYRQITAEVLLRLPAKDGSLCLACHSFEGERLK